MKETRYSDAGVDIAAANEAKKRITAAVKATHGPHVLGGIGGFGGLFSTADFPPEPVLVSSIDGVGTKLKLAFLLDRHNTVGEDIVNHCINDILVQGARPLFFMDYLATGKLEPGTVQSVVEGIARACGQNDCALLGGETAEMPGFYSEGEYDLAGTIVGVVSRRSILTGEDIESGDVLLGVASSGLHTNGYSLARKVLLEMAQIPLDETPADLERQLGDELLEPHRSYAPSILPLVAKKLIRGMVHITGGGFGGNIPRVVPDKLKTVVNRSSWKVLPIFNLIARLGNVPEDEMYLTFNMGIGLIVFVSEANANEVEKELSAAGETVYRIGHIENRGPDEEPVLFTKG
jgi:phosphoribosylformylglycinamidine cyclo-ligase